MSTKKIVVERIVAMQAVDCRMMGFDTKVKFSLSFRRFRLKTYPTIALQRIAAPRVIVRHPEKWGGFLVLRPASMMSARVASRSPTRPARADHRPRPTICAAVVDRSGPAPGRNAFWKFWIDPRHAQSPM